MKLFTQASRKMIPFCLRAAWGEGEKNYLYQWVSGCARDAPIVLGLSKHNTFYLTIKIAMGLSYAEQQAVIENRLIQHYGRITSVFYWDHSVSVEKQERLLHVIAADKRVIDEISALFKKLHRSLCRIEPIGYAVARALAQKEVIKNFTFLLSLEREKLFVRVDNNHVTRYEFYSKEMQALLTEYWLVNGSDDDKAHFYAYGSCRAIEIDIAACLLEENTC